MVTLLIRLSEQVLQQLLMAANGRNIALDEHIQDVLSKAAQSVAAMTSTPEEAPSEALLKLAIERAKQIAQGNEFHLQDLFSKAEWTTVSAPRIFGRDFRKAVEPGIAMHMGAPKGKAIYQRQ